MAGLVRDRFLWVDGMRKGLTFLIQDSIDPYFEVKQSSDPLTAYLTITLCRPLPKASREPMRVYIRAWAKTADCEVPRIDIEEGRVLATVLFKYRHPRGKTRDEPSKDGVDSGTG